MGAIFKYVSFLLPLALIGCEELFRSPSEDPRAYPYKLDVDEQHPLRERDSRSNYTVWDIDGDGEDEIIRLDNKLEQKNKVIHNLTVSTLEHKTIDELNFPDTSWIGMIGGGSFFDIDGDGIKEVFLWKIRNDSLLSLIGNFAQGSWREIVLAVKPESISNWDCGVSWCGFLDVDDDGKEDLLCYLFAQRSANPRGIFAYNIESGRKIWECRFGAVPVYSSMFVDLNGDGEKEILLGTFSPGNGAVGNDIDDFHSYVIAISKKGTILWKTKFGAKGTYATAESFTNTNGESEIAVLFSGYDPRLDSGYVAILDGRSGEILRTSSKTSDMICGVGGSFLEQEENGEMRIYVTKVKGEIDVMDLQLQVVRSVSFPSEISNNSGLAFLPDVRIGRVVSLGTVELTTNKTLLLNDKLDVVGLVDRETGVPRVLKQGNTEFPRLAFESGNEWFIASLKPQPYYLLFRYRLALIVIGLAIGYAGVWATRRFNFYYWLYVQLLHRSEAEGIVVIGKNNKLVHVNETASEILALERSSAKRPTVRGVFAAQRFSDLLRFIADAQRSGESQRAQLTLSVNTQARHIICSIAPIRNLLKRRIGWLVLLFDVTKTIEHDRIVNWAAVARNLAHEMKTPLGTILLNTEYVREHLADLPNPLAHAAVAKMRTVREEVNRLNEYVKNFMKLASVQPANLLPNDINQILNDILLFYEKRKPASVNVIKQFADHPPCVLLDVNLFTTAIINLLDNAVQAMAGNGTLTVRTILARELMNDGKHAVAISIEDTGCGISKEDAPRIFQPYFSKSEGGTGLGLVITKKVVEDHGGTITFTSEPGKGTQFCILLPCIANGPTNEREDSHR